MLICLDQTDWNRNLTHNENNISVFGFVSSFHLKPFNQSFIHISSFSVSNVFTFYLISLSNRTRKTCSGCRYCHDLARCLLRDVYRFGCGFYSPCLLSVGFMRTELHATTMVSCEDQTICL